MTHNNQETRFWRVKKERMPGYLEEIENVPHAGATDKEVQELLKRLKAFREDEFADLLHKCHNVLRNREHLGPAAAFDEIAKILFVKVFAERQMRAQGRRRNLFTTDVLDQQIGEDPLNTLFEETKKGFKDDRLFAEDEAIDIKQATGREIVRRLQSYNLSATSEDIKGVAFERFLGRTFRGEIGQFFTPRTIVEFMIRMVDPKEGETICDPASGSGGFLIRFFEMVSEEIAQDVDEQYESYKEELDQDDDLSEEERAERLSAEYERLVSEAGLDPDSEGPPESSRLWKLANRCIYGTDANGRMARTSKMNMIMHGDGHGGVHYHNGLLNVNGIFEKRFDIVLANPPFGAKVEKDDKVTDEQIAVSDEAHRQYEHIYGEAYREARTRTKGFVGKPIGSLFDLGHSATTGNLLKQKTEILFIERCLELLRPGGRLGIVLPEGIFNNPSLQYVRTYCEDRARIKAVVSLAEDTFKNAGTTAKTSLLFMEKFTKEEKDQYDTLQREAAEEIDEKYADEIAARNQRLNDLVALAKDIGDDARKKLLQKEKRDYKKRMYERKAMEARALLKQRFRYPVFLYEADHVGITATGEPDANELYPNDDVPDDSDLTCVEHYRAFQQQARSYLLDEDEADEENAEADSSSPDAADGEAASPVGPAGDGTTPQPGEVAA